MCRIVWRINIAQTDIARVVVCLAAIGIFSACKHSKHRQTADNKQIADNNLNLPRTRLSQLSQDSMSAPRQKSFGYAWWLDDHKKHREAAAMISELLKELPKIPRKDSALKYLTLYLLALPQQNGDSVAQSIEALLDPASPSYADDQVQFFNGKIRWLIWNRQFPAGRQLLDRCDSLIRQTSPAAIDSLTLVTFWENKARMLMMVKSNDSARTITEKCLHFYTANRGLYRERLYSTYAMLGILNKALLQAGPSLRCFDSAEYYLHASGRDGGVSSGVLLMSKGNAWMNIGEFDKASENYANAQAVFEGLHDTLEIGLLNHNIGLTYFIQYDFEKALKYARQAEKYLMQVLPPTDGQLLLIKQQLANISDELGDTVAAARYLDQMMTITRAVNRPDDIDYLLSEDKIADHYARTGKLDSGINLYKTLLDKMKVSEPVPGQYTDDICYDLAAVCYRNGHYADGYTYFSESAALEAKIYGPQNIYTFYTTDLAASCLMGQHLFRKAADLLYPVNQSLNDLQGHGLLGTHAYNFYKWQIPYSLLKCRYELAIGHTDTLILLLREFGDIEIFADDYLKQLTGTVDKSTQKDYDEYYSLGIEICHALYQKTRRVEYLEKAFRFSEKKKEMPLRIALKEQIATHFAGIPDSLVKKERDLSAKLAYIEKKYASAVGDHDSLSAALYDRVLSDANLQYDQLIGRLEHKYASYIH